MYSAKHSYLLAAGHLCTDMNQGTLSAMLPFVIATRCFDYAEASALVLGYGMVFSVIQPLSGWYDDRRERPWLMSLGLLIAGAGMFLLGVFAAFIPMFVCSIIIGFDVALFHPEGGRLANVIAGGNLDFAGGPLLVATAFPLLGTQGAFLFLRSVCAFGLRNDRAAARLIVPRRFDAHAAPFQQ
jgi:FSR family fosmidomycin resistance protein-like MFS transporter